VLQEAWKVVKTSTIPDVKKTDLSQLLLQTLQERGAPLVVLRLVERGCDLVVRESVDGLVAADAVKVLEEEAEDGARKKMKVDGEVSVKRGSSWRF
jgi:predicted oxidoreductase